MDKRFISNLTILVKEFNTSINSAEEKFTSEIFELLTSSKITLYTFDKLEENFKRVFRENACALKLTAISRERFISCYDVFNNEPYIRF